MKKGMKIEDLQKHLDELQKAYNEALQRERIKIGAAVQKVTGLNTAKMIFENYALIEKEAADDEHVKL